jgi:dihydroorotate dehydrogenase electron transfer subunit
MHQFKARIIYNKKFNENYFHCCLYAPKIANESYPGQFVNIKVSDSLDPLLRRPFGVHRVKSSNIEILYEVVGCGTEILSQRKAGEYLDVIGPLGCGFNYRLPITPACRPGRDYRLPILVAGGMGVAPLIFLAEKIKAKGKSLVLIGAKTKSKILCEREFRQLGCEVRVATDDGSKGFKGKVTELLKEVLRLAEGNKRFAIYACGPEPMFKEIAIISKRLDILTEVSLEAHMACGFGACLGCMVNTKNGYKRACKEGPVFNLDDIIWE